VKKLKRLIATVVVGYFVNLMFLTFKLLNIHHLVRTNNHP